MAEKIAIDIEVKSEGGAQSLKDLKKELKDLQTQVSETKEGTEEYYQALKKIGETKDKIDDLNDSIAATTGAGRFQAIANVGAKIAAGFQLASSTMAMFGSESAEVEKALQKAQAAMAFVQGIKELEGLGDALKNAGSAIKLFVQGGISALRSLWATMLANPITAILVGLTALGGAIAYLVTRESDHTKAIKENIEERKKQENQVSKQYDNEIKLAKAAGKDTTDLELKKLKAVEQNLKAQEIEYKKLAKSKGELNEDEKKEYQDLQDKLLAATTDRAAKELEIERLKLAKEREYNEYRIEIDERYRVSKMTDRNKELYELEKQQNEDISKLGKLQNVDSEKQYKEYEKSLTQINDFYSSERAKVNKKYNEIDKEAREKREKEQLDKRTKTYEDDINAIQIKTVTENEIKEEGLKKSDDLDAFWKAKMDERAAYYDKKKKERDERNKEFAISSTLETLQVIQELTSAFAGKSEAAQRKAFNINKAAQIAEATISSILAAQKAYTSQIIPGDPTSPVRGAIAAALAIASGIARVKKIASTQFEGGGGTGAGGGMEGAAGATGGAVSAPIQGGVNNTSTMLENMGQGQEQKPIKAYVLQTDVASEDQKIKAIENKSKIE